MKRFGGLFDIDSKKLRLLEVQRELENPNIWQSPEKAQALSKERVQLENIVHGLENISTRLDDARELLIDVKSDHDDELFQEIKIDVLDIEKQLSRLEFQRMFSGPMDAHNAYVDIQSGSGGTEAQDWAEMLLRMYLRFADQQGFKTTLMEVSSGDVAGIKSATVYVEGDHAFGWLRTETGVHRLVRKSPFD